MVDPSIITPLAGWRHPAQFFMSEVDREIGRLMRLAIRKEEKAARLRAARCDGKPRYESFDQAAKMADLARRRHGAKVSSYRCPDCGGWHLGSAMWD